LFKTNDCLGNVYGRLGNSKTMPSIRDQADERDNNFGLPFY